MLLFGPPKLNNNALAATKPLAGEREAKLCDLGAGFAKLAKETGCGYVTLYGAVSGASMTADGVHPDAEGNAAMTRVLLLKLLP